MAEQDITQTGPVGLKGLKGINNNKKAEDVIDVSSTPRRGGLFTYGIDYLYNPKQVDVTQTVESEPGGYGTSRHDPLYITETQLNNLEDTRARNQSNFSQIANGIIKGVTTTGTTFADGTVGLLWGLGQGVYNALDKDENTSFASGLWNNQFNQWMNQANELMEQVAPNYYTNDEREHPMSHIFNANFIGDKFIKNLGFTAGALGAAVAFGGGYGKIGHLLGKAALGLGTAGKTAVGISKAASMGIGAVAAATTEGSIEALQAAQQMGEENQQLYTNLRDSNIQEIMDNPNLSDYEKELLVEDENNKFDKVMAKLEEDKAKVGNATLAWNIPILTAGNIIQFSKLLGGGFRSASRAAKVAGKMGELRPGGLFEKTAVQRAAKALYKSGHTEGREEVLQQIASDASNTRYSLELNDYYKSLYDPEANTQASDYMAGVGKQILATLGREDTWEQYLIGSMTGVMGAPVFGKKNTQTRADFGKGKRIGWSGGVLGQYKEITEDRERNQRVADYLNERAKDPKFRDQYQRLVRHMYFQDKMDAALDEGLEKEFKDSEFAQLYNDIMWFTYAGKKDVLKDMVSGALNNITDEEVAEIVKDTTKTVTNEEGKEVTTGPFIGADGNPMTPDQIREKVAKSKNDVLNLMQKIEDEYDALDHNTNGKLSDEQLEQLTYMKLQIDDWKERTKSVGDDVDSFFKTAEEQYGKELDVANTELQADPDNKVLKSKQKVISDTLNKIRAYRAYVVESAVVSMAGSKEGRKGLQAAFRGLQRIGDVTDNTARQKAETGLRDIIKMSRSVELFNNRLKEYLENPDLINNDRDKVIKDMQDKEVEERKKAVKDSILGAANVEGLNEMYDNSPDQEAFELALDDLSEGNDTLAKQFKSNNATVDGALSILNDIQGTSIDAVDKTKPKIDVDGVDVMALQQILDIKRRTTNPEEKDGKQVVSPMNPVLSLTDAEWNKVGGIIDSDYREKLANIYHHIISAHRKASNVMDSMNIKESPKEEPKEEKKADVSGKDDVATVPATDVPADSLEENGILPVDDSTFKAQEEEENKEAERETKLEKDSNGRFTVWMNNIPEFDVKQRRNNGVYAAPPYFTHGILAANGAYEYIDSGKLKVGQTIKFKIDPSLASGIESDSIREQVERAIWLVTEDNEGEHIVGILPQDPTQVNKFSGLAEFADYLLTQWENSGKGVYVSDITTKVKELKPGFVKYSKDSAGNHIQHKLNDVFKKRVPKFTWRKYSAPGIPERKNLHVVIPSASGKNAEPLVSITHFRDAMDKDSFGTSRMFFKFKEDMRKAFQRVVARRPDGQLKEADAEEIRNVLKEYICLFNNPEGKSNPDEYLGYVHVNVGNGGIVLSPDNGEDIWIDIFDTSSNTIPGFRMEGAPAEKAVPFEKEEGQTGKDFWGYLIEKLKQLNLPIQVDFERLNEEGYMKDRLDAGVLTSNIDEDTLRDEWYTIEPVRNTDNSWKSESEAKRNNPTEETAAGERAAAIVSTPQEPETSVPETTNNPAAPEEKHKLPITPPKRKRKHRLVNRKEWVIMNKEEETEWMKKALPKLSNEERLKFVKGLIQVAEGGKQAWGIFDKGIITISDVAAEGTIYHEAFHSVFNMLLTPNEREAMFESAERLWPFTKDRLTLEENMAEEFRRYIMHKQDNSRPKNLGARIMSFFAQLWEKVKNWNSPLMYSYFAKINDGYYAEKEPTPTGAYRERVYDPRSARDVESFSRLNEIWNNPDKSTYYRKGNNFIRVPIIRRGRTSIEFWFDTRAEARDFKDFWKRETGTDFSDDYYVDKVGKWRVYMQKPQMMSIEEIEREEEMNKTPFQKLAPAEQSELKARGYTEEDFNNLSDIEQKAVKECFFVL